MVVARRYLPYDVFSIDSIQKETRLKTILTNIAFDLVQEYKVKIINHNTYSNSSSRILTPTIEVIPKSENPNPKENPVEVLHH